MFNQTNFKIMNKKIPFLSKEVKLEKNGKQNVTIKEYRLFGLLIARAVCYLPVDESGRNEFILNF